MDRGEAEMKDSMEDKAKSSQLERALLQVIKESPVASTVTALGIGIVLGALEESVKIGPLLGRIGRKILDDHRGEMIDHVIDGSIGAIAVHAGVETLSDLFGRSTPVAKGSSFRARYSTYS